MNLSILYRLASKIQILSSKRSRTRSERARRAVRVRYRRRLRFAELLEARALLAADLDVFLDGSNNLVIFDTAGAGVDNALTISNDGAGNIVITDAISQFDSDGGVGGIVGATLSNNEQTLTVPVGSFGTNVIVNSALGNDSLNVLLASSLGKTLDYHGGDGNDSLTMDGGTTNTLTHAFTNAIDGTITLEGAIEGLISYTGLEPITDNLNAVDRVFAFNGGDETIDMTASGGSTVLDSDAGASVTFVNPSATLTINAGTGNDAINLTSVGTGSFTTVTVNGGDDLDNVTFTGPLDLIAGDLNVGALNDVNNITISGIGSITTTGDISVVATTGNATVAAGGIQSAGNVSVSGSDLVTIADSGINATSGSGTVTVTSSAGSIDINGTTGIQAAGNVSVSGELQINIEDAGINATSGAGGSVTVISNTSTLAITGTGILAKDKITVTGQNFVDVTVLDNSTAATASDIIVTATTGSVRAFDNFKSKRNISLAGAQYVEIRVGIDATYGTGTVTLTSSAGFIAIGGNGIHADNNVLVTAPAGGVFSIDDLAGNLGTKLTGTDISIIAGADGIGIPALAVRIAATTVTATTNGSGNIYLAEAHSVTIADNDLDAGSGTINLTGGTFLTTATGSLLSPVNIRSGATLGGTGTTSAIATDFGSNVAPGTSPGILNSSDVGLVFGSNFNVEINGSTGAGAVGGHDQLNVTGTVSLSGANLVLALGYTPTGSHSFVIINNDDTDPVVGDFFVDGTSIPDGSEFVLGGIRFIIDYTSGTDSNDVTLSVANSQAAPTAVTLTPSSASLAENASTLSSISLSTISVTDDGIGTNELSLSGIDADSFEIVGNDLRLKAGVALDFETKSSYSVRVDVDDTSVGGTPDAFADFVLTITDVADAPSLTSVVVNGGDAFNLAAQRSQITSVVVTFSVPVVLGSNPFTIVNRDLPIPQQVPIPVNVTGSGTTYTIRFGAGSGVVTRDTSIGLGRGNSLADGNFLLTIDPSKVKDLAEVQTLTPTNSFGDGDNEFGDRAVDNFFRMFGDSDGSGIVNSLDTGAFARALTTYNAAVDFDGNGVVLNSGVDRTSFLANYNKKRRSF